jgi:hypothetical protein
MVTKCVSIFCKFLALDLGDPSLQDHFRALNDLIFLCNLIDTVFLILIIWCLCTLDLYDRCPVRG